MWQDDTCHCLPFEGSLKMAASPVLGLQGYLLSCALDGSVKIWAPMETPQPNSVLETTPNYSHPPSSENGQVCKQSVAPAATVSTSIGSC